MAIGVSNWSVTTGANVALVASTAKSVIGVQADANKSFKLCEFAIGFTGTDATLGPVLVELCAATFATNAPGTNSTALTPVLQSGKAVTDEISAARNWTSEPTVLTALKEWTVDSNKGLLILQYPLGREPEAVIAQGFVLRCTSATSSTPNVRSYMEIET